MTSQLDSDQPTKGMENVMDELSGSEENAKSGRLDSDEEEELEEAPPEPNADNPFLSLPVEIMDFILTHLPKERREDHRLHLIHTSSALYSRYRNEFLVDHFEQCQHIGAVVIAPDAKEGEFGWKPFLITDAGWYGEDAVDEDEPWISYLELDFEEYRKKEPTRNYLKLQVTGVQVMLDDAADWLCTETDAGRDSVEQ